MSDFDIRFLDHVAIRVADMDRSIKWYETVLGLKMYRLKKWGEFPVFMLAGKSGLALFPADVNHPAHDTGTKAVAIEHFAFNVTNDDFEKARLKYDQLGLNYRIMDHHYFHSIYTNDPDGHEVELTTIMVDEDDFYS